MGWIKLETHTPNKLEIFTIAQELNIEPDAVLGKCCRVWAWFDDNTTDGVTKSVTKVMLDRQCGVTGFCEAMINAGWMFGDGVSLQLPYYDRHNTQTAKSRALGAKRQAKFKANAEGNANGNDDALPKPSQRKEKKRSKPLSGSPDSVAILSHLNEQANRSYKPVKANCGLIDARLNEGATVDECRAVIDVKVRAWLHDPKMQDFLRPATLFNATNFANYVGQLDGATGPAVRDWE